MRDERVKRYHEAQKRRGLKQTKVWVPANKILELQALAKKWREEAKP